MAFIFDASKDTPAGLARKRAVAEALAGPTPVPRNVGEGLSALGEAIGYRMTLGDIARSEAAGDAPPPVRAGAAGSTARGSDMNGPTAGTPAVQRVAQALNPGAYRSTAIDMPGHAPAAPAMPSPVSAIPASPVRAASSSPAGPGAAPPGALPTQAPYPTPRPAIMPDLDARTGSPEGAQHGTNADPLSILGRELDRYENLVKETGIEAMPGQEKDSLNAVRQGIMLRMKPLFDRDGPDLSAMEPMIYDPVVAPFKDGGLYNLPGQLWTGVTGGAGARAKNSADELRRMLANTRNVNAINEKYGLE